jgi:hypothetical protein
MPTTSNIFTNTNISITSNVLVIPNTITTTAFSPSSLTTPNILITPIIFATSNDYTTPSISAFTTPIATLIYTLTTSLHLLLTLISCGSFYTYYFYGF